MQATFMQALAAHRPFTGTGNGELNGKHFQACRNFGWYMPFVAYCSGFTQPNNDFVAHGHTHSCRFLVNKVAHKISLSSGVAHHQPVPVVRTISDSVQRSGI
jgi:hypothetical protein